MLEMLIIFKFNEKLIKFTIFIQITLVLHLLAEDLEKTDNILKIAIDFRNDVSKKQKERNSKFKI